MSQTHAARPGLDDPSSDDAGAWIELYVLLGGWQEPWTVVQWPDPSGTWNNVDGWRGRFDAIQNGVDYKSWWVGQEHLGEGPFRWIVYEKSTGAILAQSDLFYLPTEINQTVIIEIAP